jgi:chromosome segregation ATPase
MDTRRAKAADALRDGLDDMFDGADDLLSAWEGRHGGKKATTAISSVSDPLHRSRTQLAALTVTVKLDSFKDVKAAMDKLATELQKQQTEEVEFKSKCVKNFNGNEKAVFKKSDEKEDLEASLTELAAQMKALDEDIDAAKQQISDTKTEVMKASQNREAENAQFQRVVADQRATQDILKKALAKLTAFYKKKGAFVQLQAVQTPPAQFTDYKKSSGSSPVIGMIQQIIEDSVQLEQESMSGEKQAQAEYVKTVKDSNDLIKSLSKAMVDNQKKIAEKKMKTAEAKGDLESANGELESLGKVEEDLHKECDFVLKNFEVRQKARATEMEAIQAAKGILSGAK